MSVLQFAKDFLKMHEGSCSVHRQSPYGISFLLLEQTGKVVVKPSGTSGFIDVYSPDFKPKFNGEKNE